MTPLLSIVIANYNYGRFLEEAIESVISQDMGGKVELIICDAKSSDNSVNVIQKYANGLPPNTHIEEWTCKANTEFKASSTPLITWWCSEKDNGQSAAFNKGFSHARGRFLTWLNADDVLLPGTLMNFEEATKRHPACEWFVGGCFWLDPEMRIINCGRGRNFSEIRYREGNVSVWGPSSFFTKGLLDSVGGMDERFHYMMDTDLWMRFACKAGARYQPFCKYAWGLRLHPDAKMSGHNFTANGKLDSHHKESEKLDRSQHRDQIAREAVLMRSYFIPHRSSTYSRIISAAWLNVLGAKLDLYRWRGMNYKEVFK